MSEELEALKRVGKRKYQTTVADITGFERITISVKQDNKKDYQIIEKALKRLEELDNGAYVSIHINRYNELCDKEDAFDTLSKEDEKAKKLLSKEIEKNRAFEIIKKYGHFDNDTGDLIIHIPDGKNEDKEYDLLKRYCYEIN